MTKLLLVEDDPGIVRSLTEFLQSEGFLVDSASGQGSACRLLEEPALSVLYAEAQKKLGRTIVVYDVTLTDGEERLVASGTFTFFVKQT